jgi:arginyl-tRNA synthetase
VYRRLDVDKRLQLFGESQYNGMIPAVLAELEAKGLLQLSDGALIFPVPGEEVPLMVRKRDGGVGYDSTDLAAIHYRLHGLKMDWLVYVVDAGQSLHFDLVFKGAQIAGWYRPLPTGADYAPAEALTADAVAAAEGGAKSLWSADAKPALVMHTGFGVIQGEDRKKFKTRSGDTVRLVDVLDEAKERAKTALRDRIASGNTPVVADDAAIERTASVLGYGGVKYFDLRQHRTTDYIFNYDRMLSPDGDTAVYLEYAHARLCSILRKARESGVDVDGILASAGAEGVRFSHPTETALITELLRFPEVMRRTTAALTPHLLCEFVYAVANRTAEFHRDCHVLGTSTPPEVRAARLRMVAAVQLVIAETLRILGITPLDRI